MRRSQVENPKDYLLLSLFADTNYANAILLSLAGNYVATAKHVSDGNPTIVTPDLQDVGYFSFRPVRNRDLSISHQRVPGKGFSTVYRPNLGEVLLICGYHGRSKEYYETQVRVIGFDVKQRIIAQRISGKKLQPGMSGSPGIGRTGALAGLLVAPADPEGEQVYLEPAIAFQDS